MSNSVRPHRWQPTRLPCPWDSPGKNTGVGCHFLLQCMKVKSESEVAQLCPTFSDPMDSSPPGSSVHEIFQARVLEWGAIAFSNMHTSRIYNLIPDIHIYVVVVVQLLSRVWLFATPLTVVLQAFLSFTVSWSLLNLMSIELVMLSNHLIPCYPFHLLPSVFPSFRIFSNEKTFPVKRLFRSGGQSIGASASVLPMNIQDRFPLGGTGLISLQSKGLSRVFSRTAVGRHQFLGT